MTARNRRPLQWFTSQTDFQNLVGNAQTNLTLFNTGSSVAQPVKGATVTRMIVELMMKGVSLAQDLYLFWGVAVVNGDARAAGAFPDADDITDRANWLMRGRMYTIHDSLTDGSQVARREYDLHSQRVFRNAEDELQLVLDNGNANTLAWAAFIRVLMKFP